MRALLRGLLAAAILLTTLPVEAEQPSDGWTFAVTPYLWLPNVDGTLKYSAPPGGGGGPEVGVGPSSYLENLSAAFMLSGEARKGKWSIVSDLIYLDFENERSPTAGITTSLDGLQWMLAAGHTAARAPRMILDVLGGVRYLGIEASSTGGVSERTDLWDAIIGVRGRVRLGESQWFMPFHLDLGAGSSSFTWQGLLAISYAFKWGDATLGYRHLYYDQSGDRLFHDFRFSGPTLGATFRF